MFSLRLHRFAIAFVLCLFAACVYSSDDERQSPESRWETAKSKFISDLQESLESVDSQLSSKEAKARSSGDVTELSVIKRLRSSLVEDGKLPPGVDPKTYDSMRQQALEALESSKDAIVASALKRELDPVATAIDEEFKLLSQLQFSEIEARWGLAVKKYQSSIRGARDEIREQIVEIEDAARKEGDISGVDWAKNAIERLEHSGVIPDRVLRRAYDLKVKTANRQLEDVNESLVQELLVGRWDKQAKEMQGKLTQVLNTPLSTPVTIDPQDKRTTWNNKSYSTVYFNLGDGKWEERYYDGKLVREVREVRRTDKYIELLLLDRNHHIRFFRDHAMLLENGRWKWVANGFWTD